MVDVEEVVRVIGRFHCREPLVVGAIVCGRTVVVVAGHEVDIAPIAAREGMNSCVGVLHPLDVGLVVGRVRPYSYNYRGKVLVSMSEDGLVGAAPSSPAPAVNRVQETESPFSSTFKRALQHNLP